MKPLALLAFVVLACGGQSGTDTQQPAPCVDSAPQTETFDMPCERVQALALEALPNATCTHQEDGCEHFSRQCSNGTRLYTWEITRQGGDKYQQVLTITCE